MKFFSYATLAAVLLALGGCAGLGPTDASSNQAGPATSSEPATPPSYTPQYPDGALTPLSELDAAPRTVTALTAPADLCLFNTGGVFDASGVRRAYRGAGATAPRIESGDMAPDALAQWVAGK